MGDLGGQFGRGELVDVRRRGSAKPTEGGVLFVIDDEYGVAFNAAIGIELSRDIGVLLPSKDCAGRRDDIGSIADGPSAARAAGETHLAGRKTIVRFDREVIVGLTCDGVTLLGIFELTQCLLEPRQVIDPCVPSQMYPVALRETIELNAAADLLEGAEQLVLRLKRVGHDLERYTAEVVDDRVWAAPATAVVIAAHSHAEGLFNNEPDQGLARLLAMVPSWTRCHQSRLSIAACGTSSETESTQCRLP